MLCAQRCKCDDGVQKPSGQSRSQGFGPLHMISSCAAGCMSSRLQSSHSQYQNCILAVCACCVSRPPRQASSSCLVAQDLACCAPKPLVAELNCQRCHEKPIKTDLSACMYQPDKQGGMLPARMQVQQSWVALSDNVPFPHLCRLHFGR